MVLCYLLTKRSLTAASLLHPRLMQLRGDGGFSEMQNHVIIKKEQIKEELFYSLLVPKSPTNPMNKSEVIHGNISPSIAI